MKNCNFQTSSMNSMNCFGHIPSLGYLNNIYALCNSAVQQYSVVYWLQEREEGERDTEGETRDDDQ